LTSDSGLFGGIYERGRAAAELTDAAWLQAGTALSERHRAERKG